MVRNDDNVAIRVLRKELHQADNVISHLWRAAADTEQLMMQERTEFREHRNFVCVLCFVLGLCVGLQLCRVFVAEL